jgi:hypothetical protein
VVVLTENQKNAIRLDTEKERDINYLKELIVCETNIYLASVEPLKKLLREMESKPWLARPTIPKE